MSDGKIAGAGASLEIDGVAAAPAGAKVHPRADQRVGVELVAVELGTQELAPWPQCLELAAHAADLAPGGLIRLPELAFLQSSLDDERAMVRQIRLSAVVPLGIGELGADGCRIDLAAIEVEPDLEAARTLPVAAADRELVHVLRRTARGFGIFLVVRPVDVDHVGRKEQQLALVDQGERVTAAIRVQLASTAAAVRRLALLLAFLQARIARILTVRAEPAAGPHLAPQRYRQAGLVEGAWAQAGGWASAQNDRGPELRVR